MGGRKPYWIGRIKQYIIPTLFITAALLTGCGREVTSPEQADGGGREVETDYREPGGSKEPDNSTAQEGTAGQGAWEDNAAALPAAGEEQPSGSGENGSVMAVSLQGRWIDWVFYSEGCYCYLKDGLYGYLAEDGREISPCIYSGAAPFSEGLACVCLDGKYGYIGKDGETVLPFIYDQASPFGEGTAYFSRGEEYGLIDREGNVVLRLEGCDSISSFREGLAYFSQDGRYGYMDQSGRIVISPIYDDAGYFQGGLAVVRKNGLCGVIGRDGREVVSPRYESISLEESGIIACREELYYLLDRGGRELLDGGWDYIYEDYVQEGVFKIWWDSKCGLADGEGEILLEPVYAYIDPVPGRELAIVRDENGGYGVLDYDGQVRVPFIYSEIYVDTTGGLRVKDRDTGKIKYLDGEDFSERAQMSYDSVGYFTENRAVVGLDGKYGVIRYDGTLELPLEYDSIALFTDGVTAVWMGETAELRDRQGNLILSGQYDYIRELGDGYETEKAGKKSYWDRQGSLIADGYSSRFYTAYGAESTYILNYAQGNNILLRTKAEDGQIAEEVLLTNWITPEAGPLAEFLKRGIITLEDPASGHIEELGDKGWCERRFCKLYGIGEERLLYFYAEPWEQSGFPESYSGLFILRDGQVEQLTSGYECGGSLRGNYVCFAYDREEDIWKPGTWGNWGGFGGYSGGGHVYTLQDGQTVEEISFLRCQQTARNYDEGELLENAELFYDGEDKPFTEKEILEAEYVTEYTVCGKQVSVEEYQAVSGRYRFFMPLAW